MKDLFEKLHSIRSRVSFDAGLHEYKDPYGNVYPSVSAFIKEHWPLNTSMYKNGVAARDRGTEIHELTALVDTGAISLEDVQGTPHFVEVSSWVKFIERTEFDIIDVELPFINLKYKYAGTLDRLGIRKGGGLTILDLKTGAKAKWHVAQLGAYAYGLRDEGVDVQEAFAVYTKNGARPEKVDIERGCDAWQDLMENGEEGKLWQSLRTQ